MRVGCWSLLGGTQGGLVLRRTLDGLGVAWADLADLDAAALADPATTRIKGPTPHASPPTARRARPAGAGATWRAAIEAETRDAAERIATMARIVGPHDRLVVTGGWCASAAVLAAKRRLFGPLIVADATETGTLGAAMLAAQAAGRALAPPVRG